MKAQLTSRVWPTNVYPSNLTCRQRCIELDVAIEKGITPKLGVGYISILIRDVRLLIQAERGADKICKYSEHSAEQQPG